MLEEVGLARYVGFRWSGLSVLLLDIDDGKKKPEGYTPQVVIGLALIIIALALSVVGITQMFGTG